jgi:Dolichyl-phosphate-mannose-protein mannosyltransferase
MFKFIKENPNRFILFLILFIGSVLRFYHFTGMSLSNDEFSAMARAQLHGFSEFIRNGISADIHPAGVEFFLYIWIKIFGTSVFMVRLPFIIMGILSIYIAYKITSRWFNEHTGLFVAATISFLQFPILYSQLARPFGPAFFFSLLTVWYWTKFLFDEKTERRNIISLALSVVVAAYCHYFALVFVVVVLISGSFFLKRNNLRQYLLAIGIAVILYIPNIFVIIAQLHNPATVNWIKVPGDGWFFEHIYFIFNNSLSLLSIALAIFVATHIISFTEVKLTKFHLLSVVWFVVPFFIAYFYSLWVKPIIENQILLYSFMFLLIFLYSFIQIERSRLNYWLIGILILTGLISTVFEKNYYSTYHFAEFKDIAAKATDWNKTYGEKNVTNVININSSYYINYYLDKENPLKFAMYKNEGHLDLHKLNNIVKQSSTEYFLYAWTGVVDPNETYQIIQQKYPYIIKQIDYNGMASIALFSMNDKAHAIKQPEPVYYVFNGFEDKQTWDKDTSIISTEKVWKGKYSVKLDERDEYGPSCANRISHLTDKPFKKVQCSLWAYATGTFKDAQVVAEISFKDDDNQVYENYFWLSSKFDYFIDQNKWGQVFFSFNLPELRSRNDELKIFVWNPDKHPLYIDNFEMKLFEK